MNLDVYPNPHQENCPWHSVAETTGAPNIKWCEATKCSWISESANTFSNIFLILAGIYIIKKFKKSSVKYFGSAVCIMGLGSFLYHASNVFALQLLDFFGMFLVLFLIIFLPKNSNLDQSKSSFKKAIFASTLSLPLIVACYYLKLPFQVAIFFLIIFYVVTEIRKSNERRYLFYALVTLVLAVCCSIMDHRGIWCEPESWIQGHAMWHIISAIGMIFVAFHIDKSHHKTV